MDLTFPIFAIAFWAQTIYEQCNIKEKKDNVTIQDVIRLIITMLIAVFFTVIS